MPVYFLQLVFFTVERKSSRTKKKSWNTIYMFSLYNFYLKWIIKKNYLPPYGPPLTWCNLFYCVSRIIICFINYSFGWELLLGQLLLCFNSFYVLKITDIYVNNAVNNRNAWILGIHDRQICVIDYLVSKYTFLLINQFGLEEAFFD